MYDHVGLHVKNLTASVAFYEAALAPLGYGLCSRDETSAGFGPPNEPALWLYASKAAGAAHVAFLIRAQPCRRGEERRVEHDHNHHRRGQDEQCTARETGAASDGDLAGCDRRIDRE